MVGLWGEPYRWGWKITYKYLFHNKYTFSGFWDKFKKIEAIADVANRIVR